MATYPFDIITHSWTRSYAPGDLAARPFIQRERDAGAEDTGASRHEREAPLYEPAEPLRAAINSAVALGQPLLLTGEPGTGKTQAAYYIADRLKLGKVIEFQVRSTTAARDLVASFDAVAYMAESLRARDAQPDATRFVRHGALWQAFASQTPRVVLIDEIDKAPRDFPNDLLRELDQWEIEIPESGEQRRVAAASRPIVVITSNGERQLPEPFLRRCIFHHIVLGEEDVRRVLQARWSKGHFPGLGAEVLEAAPGFLRRLQSAGFDKPPALAELLTWLGLLGLRGVPRLPEDPAQAENLEVLVKTREDRAKLGMPDR